MSKWSVRTEVPDSDGEDEIIASDEGIPSVVDHEEKEGYNHLVLRDVTRPETNKRRNSVAVVIERNEPRQESDLQNVETVQARLIGKIHLEDGNDMKTAELDRTACKDACTDSSGGLDAEHGVQTSSSPNIHVPVDILSVTHESTMHVDAAAVGAQSPLHGTPMAKPNNIGASPVRHDALSSQGYNQQPQSSGNQKNLRTYGRKVKTTADRRSGGFERRRSEPSAVEPTHHPDPIDIFDVPSSASPSRPQSDIGNLQIEASTSLLAEMSPASPTLSLHLPEYAAPTNGTLTSSPGSPEAHSVPIHTRTQTPDAVRRASISSSDLSDVDMEILSSSPNIFFNYASSRIVDTMTRPTTVPSDMQDRLSAKFRVNDQGSLAPSVRVSDEAIRRMTAPAREFRTRKAIQLHPYLLENQRYKELQKAHGIRPVHVSTTDHRAPRNTHDTQDEAFENEYSFNVSHTQETTPPDSSVSSGPPASTTVLRRVPLLRAEDEFPDDDDFPDTAVVRQRNIDGGIQQGYKRRKTVGISTNGDSLDQNIASSILGTREYLRSLELTSRSPSVSIVPLSPPNTSSPRTADAQLTGLPVFRRPHGLSSRIETPMTSSPPRRIRPTPRRLPSLSDSDLDSTPKHLSQDDQDNGSGHSSSRDSEAEARELRRMRKRIKGVLPASYLNIDVQKLQSKPSTFAHHQRDSAKSNANLKGVAQRVTAGITTTPVQTPQRIVLSDDSDNTSDASMKELHVVHTSDVQPRSPRQQHLRPFGEDVEVEEYDEIDRMLPSDQRARFKKGKSKKLQSRLTDGFVKPIDAVQKLQRSSSRTVVSSRRNRQAAGHGSNPKPKTKRKAHPKRSVQLSILDAPREAATGENPEAPFLRLAARQARKQANLGRHSPTGKTIRLATHDDTRDALRPLQSWNAGNLRPSSFVNPSEDGQDSVGSRSFTTSQSIRRILKQTRLGPSPRTHLPSSADAGDNPQRPSIPLAKDTPNRRRSNLRPGQLESTATGHARNRDFLTFAPEPSRLMEIFKRDRAGGAPSRFRLERFLQDSVTARGAEAQDVPQDEGDTVMEHGGFADNPALEKRARKRLARRMDVELRTYRQPSEPLPESLEAESIAISHPDIQVTEILHGLGSFGTRYPTDFDVRPLELGTYFHQRTFIGSGDFADAITLRSRDLDIPAGRISIDLGGDNLHWSAWNEEVSTGLSAIFATCSDGLQALIDAESQEARQDLFVDISTCINYLFRSLVRYLSCCLHFTDPVDRSPCVNRLSCFLDDIYDMLQEQIIKLESRSEIASKAKILLIDSLLYIMCVSAQTARISQHPGVEAMLQQELADKIVKVGRRVVALSLPGRFIPIRSFLEDHRQHAKREAGIQDDQTAIKCIVMVNHIFQSISTRTNLSDILLDQMGAVVQTSCDAKFLDQIWYDIFAVQPLLEIDMHGLYRPGSRFQASNDNWSLIRILMQRLFRLYPATARGSNPTLNDYVRACLTRAHCLIAQWSWRRCETVLNTVYDFFAANDLSQLQNEDSRGSPRFLEELDKDPSVHVEGGDSAFHIFLKLLVVGLQSMQVVYSKTKIQGFAWRFLPNHGRTYRKDQEISQLALDSLRNNHDLLCTLYWALPQGSGPRLEMIKNLVDHTTSHREACRLSVHAWGIIANYQLSRGEQFADLGSLALWFKDMVHTTISQHRLARSEAEMQYAQARANGSIDITHDMVELTISSNQRGISATLLDLLQALQKSVHVSRSWDPACNLVNLADLVGVFKLFSPEQPRLFVAVSQALDITQELCLKAPKSSILDSQHGSEESQDYGDWSYLEDATASGEVAITMRPGKTQLDFLHKPLATLLSSCIGSDRTPDDDLLKKVVTVWTAITSEYVKHKVHDWSSYLDTYSTSSWFQLCNTDQRRKYTPYYLSSVIDADVSALKEYKFTFLGNWLVCLLDRESMLKYQHQLTTSLLNSLPEDDLLQNLPFASSRSTGRFAVSLAEIRQRRISLIDCILSNIHSSMGRLGAQKSTLAADLRREYADMLRQSMAFMRKNYEELQQMSTANGDSHTFVRSAYVVFVQHVVSLMQQYTVDICPIDKFFIDSSVFPLPSSDPTYVVGRLKSYSFKLMEPRTRKQLAVFIQTVSERAAVDDEQTYLVDQLHQAMTGKATDSLRSVLMTSVLPAYLECASSTICGWILALPLIEATALVFDDLIYDLDIQNNVQSNITTVTTMLFALCSWTIQVVGDIWISSQAHTLRLLQSVFHAVRAGLTMIDYINRRTGSCHDAAKLVGVFVSMGKYLVKVLSTDGDAISPDIDNMPLPPSQQYPDTAAFSKRGLHDELERCWAKQGNQYVVLRGNTTRELTVDLGLVDDERDAAADAISEFLRAHKVVFEREVHVDAMSQVDSRESALELVFI